MRTTLGKSAIVLVLLAGVLIASVAAVGMQGTRELALNGAQLDRILAAVRSEPREPAPLGFTGDLGSTVPASIELKTLPRDVVTSLHLASGLQFVKLRKRILLVDSSTRMVVHVIYQPGSPAPRRPRPSGHSAV
jgi:uncharacterized protein DUF1236